MKKLRQPQSKLHERGDSRTIIENNSKVDHQLVSEFYRVTEEYERLVTASKGVIRVTQGADYNLSHPLASKDKPTDAYHLSKRKSGEKQGADYNLAHPLASKDRPTDVYHLGKRGSAVKKA
jgi:hypothetical protein